MHIFVTNLPWSMERRASIAGQLDALGLRFETPECTVGAALSEDDIGKAVDPTLVARLPWFSPGMIGCTMTCNSIYDAILGLGLASALYLEDDTILPPDLPELLDAIEREIRDGDVVLLHYTSPSVTVLSNRDDTTLTSRYRLKYPMDLETLGSGSAFVVTAGAARRMLAANRPIQAAPDWWNHFVRNGSVARVRCVSPLPVKTGDFRTTLDYGRATPLVAMVAGWIDRYRIAPLLQVLRWRRRRLKGRRERVELTNERSPLASAPEMTMTSGGAEA